MIGRQERISVDSTCGQTAEERYCVLNDISNSDTGACAICNKLVERVAGESGCLLQLAEGVAIINRGVVGLNRGRGLSDYTYVVNMNVGVI